MINQILSETLFKVKTVLFKPQRARATSKQIEVTEDGSSAVLLVEELVHEKMHSSTERINGEISDIFCKDKECKGCTEGQVSECGLHKITCETVDRMSNRKLLTSTAMPGKNMTTANAWKNLRLALTPRVGTCLSAASNNSVATCELLDKLGRLAKLGNVSPSALVGADGVAENSTCGF